MVHSIIKLKQIMKSPFREELFSNKFETSQRLENKVIANISYERNTFKCLKKK